MVPLILKSQQGLHIKNHTQTTEELPSPSNRSAASKQACCYRCCRYMCYCSIWLTRGTAANWKENCIRLCQVNQRNVLCLLKCILSPSFGWTVPQLGLCCWQCCVCVPGFDFSEVRYLGRDAPSMLICCWITSPSRALVIALGEGNFNWETTTSINSSENSGQVEHCQTREI